MNWIHCQVDTYSIQLQNLKNVTPVNILIVFWLHEKRGSLQTEFYINSVAGM